MLRFAIIGTGKISHTFMKAALKVPGFKLEAVYSRSQDSGRAFGSVYGVDKVYTTLKALGDDPEVDAVYIASPNSSHCAQTVFMLEHGKHGQLGQIRRAVFQYCQYSARYDGFKHGIIENAFNPALSNAALMDIGVYCIHPMVLLFGKPRQILASGIFLPNHLDGAGTVLIDYGSRLGEVR